MSVVALNVRYYSYGLTEVVETLDAIGADIALLSENVLTPAQLQTLRQKVYPAEFHMGR